jgi:hypothetical protein
MIRAPARWWCIFRALDSLCFLPSPDELEAFHSRKIVLERRKGGAKLVSDIDLIPRKGKRRLLGRFLRHRKAAPTKAA